MLLNVKDMEMVKITINRKTGKVKIEDDKRAVSTQGFTGGDSDGNSYFGYCCPKGQERKYIIKAFEQEIEYLKNTIAKAQKTIDLYERKLRDYRL